MTGRTLVAGVGNVFLRDDAFGVEVVRLLGEQPRDRRRADPRLRHPRRPPGLRAARRLRPVRAGRRGAAGRGAGHGQRRRGRTARPRLADQPGHRRAQPDAGRIFALLASLGGRPGRSLLVACEPADVSAGMGLSDPVAEALPHAVRAVEEILAQASRRTRRSTPGSQT
jgi:hydrogenase maturation protease